MVFSHRRAGKQERASGELRFLPIALIGMRFVLGPLLFVDAWDGITSVWFLAGLTAAFLSDVFDGVIARRVGAVTAGLREADGQTDVWLYSWIAASAWLTHRDILIVYRVPLLIVISTQILAWIVDWAKYRRFSNYHAYSAKAWGVALFVATIALFGFNATGVFLWPAIVCGMVCTLEEIAITLILPVWTYDVASVFHALRCGRPHARTLRKRSDGRGRFFKQNQQ